MPSSVADRSATRSPRQGSEVSVALYFHACPRCKGTLQVQRDVFSTYLQCINCSRIVELDQKAAEKKTTQRRAA